MTLNKKYEIILTTQFKEKLEKNYNYIKFNLNAPNNSNRLYKEIRRLILGLEIFPESYPKLIKLNDKKSNIRKMYFKKHIILYEFNSKTRTSLYFTNISL